MLTTPCLSQKNSLLYQIIRIAKFIKHAQNLLDKFSNALYFKQAIFFYSPLPNCATKIYLKCEENMINRELPTDKADNFTEAIREEILDEIADLEEYARQGKQPPLCRGYRIRINGERYVVHTPFPTGREILQIANLNPPENYTLRLKATGQQPRKVELNEKVDLRHPGIEKFKALPRDQQEG
ncbi:multiubiquitin domain-containing protein [Aetokthonos hydrillicola]|nr:multiubiquitin domain-containing protein [Aetokthonos hydrillicola]